MLEQPVVDARHGTGGRGAAPVQQRHKRQALGVPGAGAVRFELHERGELVQFWIGGRGWKGAGGAVARGGKRRGWKGAGGAIARGGKKGTAQGAAEPREVLGGQVDPAGGVVLADVPQDVGELERDTE